MLAPAAAVPKLEAMVPEYHHNRAPSQVVRLKPIAQHAAHLRIRKRDGRRMRERELGRARRAGPQLRRAHTEGAQLAKAVLQVRSVLGRDAGGRPARGVARSLRQAGRVRGR
eukprot:scaffold324611_cov61-Tisochrysis_lutea.AAC.1